MRTRQRNLRARKLQRRDTETLKDSAEEETKAAEQNPKLSMCCDKVKTDFHIGFPMP